MLDCRMSDMSELEQTVVFPSCCIINNIYNQLTDSDTNLRREIQYFDQPYLMIVI
jgi:hypothetical protein